MADKAAGDIIDYQAGKVRILEDKCKDCIFRPGNLMHLGHGRLKEVVDGNLAASALLTCHNTLPGNERENDPAACRGFWDAYGLQTAAGRMAKFVIGIIWTKLKEDNEQVQPGWEEESACDRHEQEEGQAGPSDGE